MGKIIYIVGLVLGIFGCIDIWKSKLEFLPKIIFMVLLLATSWVGIAVHYLYGKKHLK